MYQSELSIHAVDAHTAGEPIRVITSGLPPIPGATMLDRYRYLGENLDHLRKIMMLEPRGHSDMFGCIITPPASDDGHFGVLFTHNSGQSTMCGHGTIGAAKVVVATGMIPASEGDNEVRIDAPAGRVTANVRVENGTVTEVSFQNVPSFLHTPSMKVTTPELGDVEIAISYGGAFYVFADARQFGLQVVPEQIPQLVRTAMILKNHVNATQQVIHPENSGIKGIYGVIITEPVTATQTGFIGRNICVFAEGAVDRSPCGTGTSARMSLLHGTGVMKPHQTLVNESVIGTQFTGTIIKETNIGGKIGIVPRVAGNAWITGFNHLILEPTDPLREGFHI